MFPVNAGLPGLPSLNMPNVCTKQLQSGSAFCDDHYKAAVEQKYPTKIRDFLKYCGISNPGT